jgi:alpha-tubulin suppressor-like RCC1 family protein
MQVREIWAGSEFAVVADYSGLLWSCGWNEHGNLSRGGSTLSEKGANDGGESTKFETARNWVPVVDKHGKQVELSVVWEGALACGGGHVICLPNSKRMTY